MSNMAMSILLNMISIIAVGGGSVLFAFGCLRLIRANNDNLKKLLTVPIISVIISFILISFGVILAVNLNEKNENEIDQQIEQQIAMKLNTVSENIIIEDLSESIAFFHPSKINQEIRKVYFDGKTYKVLIEKNEVVRIEEVVE